MASKHLTTQQEEFVINYIKNGYNAYNAALTAGYSKTFADTGAYKLVHHPIIQKRLTKALKRADNKLNMTFEWKMKKLKRIIDQYIPDDINVELKESQVKIGLQAMGELNKMQGDYAPDKRLSVTVDATKEKIIEAKKAYDEF